MTKYHCKRSEPEKKSLVIKYFSPLPSSSLLLTDHFSSVTLEFDFSWFPQLSFYFLFSDSDLGPGAGEGEVSHQGRGEAGQPRPLCQPLGTEAAPDPGPGQEAQLLRSRPEWRQHRLELEKHRAQHPGVSALTGDKTGFMKSSLA